MDEKVLVVARSELFAEIETPQGFTTDNKEKILERIGRYGKSAPRVAAENDPSLKQIIPYTLVSCGSLLFCCRRYPEQDEKRLGGLYSLGIGGHINPEKESGTGLDIVQKGLERELNEELAIDTDYALELVGFINDETNEVGSVHFGLAYHLIAETDNIEVREKEIMSGSFIPVTEAQSHYRRMETWSQILLNNIDLFNII